MVTLLGSKWHPECSGALWVIGSKAGTGGKVACSSEDNFERGGTFGPGK